MWPVRCRPAEIAVSQVCQHERVEPARVEPLIEDVRQNGVLQSIHVTMSSQGWLVLDGAHRSTAVKAVGSRTIPAHVAVLPDEVVVPGWSMTLHPAFLPWLRAQDTGHGPVIAIVREPSRAAWSIRRSDGTDPGGRVRAMQSLGDVLHSRPYGRLLPDQWRENAGLGTLEWVLPTWGELIAGVRSAGPLPAGVTRLLPLWSDGCPDYHKAGPKSNLTPERTQHDGH